MACLELVDFVAFCRCSCYRCRRLLPPPLPIPLRRRRRRRNAVPNHGVKSSLLFAVDGPAIVHDVSSSFVRWSAATDDVAFALVLVVFCFLRLAFARVMELD